MTDLLSLKVHYSGRAMVLEIFSAGCLLIVRPSMVGVKEKIYGVLYNQSSYIAFDEASSYWSAPKRS